jgi:hypothetical protein
MSEFTYLFRGDTTVFPEQAQTTMQKWDEWMKELSANGHIREAGRPLERTGKVVKGKLKIVKDGPYAEAKDLVGGYMVIDARDLTQAVEISKGCPILEGGGSVEVRPTMKMTA